MGKKQDNRKITNVSISVVFEKDQHAAKASVHNNGDIIFFDKDGNEILPKSMKREMSHDRSKGPKVRSRQVLDHGKGAFSGLQHLSEYEVIYAIDTNTADVGGKGISVAGFLPFSLEARDNGFEVTITEEHVQLYEFDRVLEKPELFSILKLTRDLGKHAGIGRESRVAIVTDTELGSLDAFNARDIPIYEDYFLPEGFTLLYASSDTGWEVLNKFIRMCDKAADQTIKDRRAGNLTEAPFVSVEGFPNIKTRFGRRNARLTLENSTITDIGLRPGQEVSYYTKKK